MSLWKLYDKEKTTSGVPVLVMAMVSGLANALILAIMNKAIGSAPKEVLSLKYLVLFALTFGVFFIGKKYALSQTSEMVEKIIRKIRMRISDKIRHSELRFLENIGSETIYTRITHDTNLISQSAIIVICALQSSVMLVFCLLYVAVISKIAFVMTAFAITVGVMLYMSHRKITVGYLHETTIKESRFFERLSFILNGFKELKINEKKSDDFFRTVDSLADETEEIKVKTGLRFVTDMMFSDVFFYLLIAAIIFLMPKIHMAFGGQLIRVITAILFIMGPLNLIVASFPIITRANVAAENLYELEEQIDKASRKGAGKRKPLETFESIIFEDVCFSYLDRAGDPAFTVGPINMTIGRGEVLFIVGGNGSGKSTVLKLLTGLYYPSSGAIKIDGQEITDSSYQSYRELFSIIFTDFHLFDRLYGIDGVDYGKFKELLRKMELDKKTDLADGEFTNISLSTGQRKRLAMIVSMFEDKQIYVYDEWAADQDPIFRKYFYEVLLQEMKEQGKTIVAVSHDDRYFDVADRILKMEYGKFVEEKG